MEDSEGHKYDVVSYWEHLTADYMRISILQVEELDYFDYLEYRRDAFIYSLNQTESGREYLDNAYRLEQTAPDKNSLREQFRKGGN